MHTNSLPPTDRDEQQPKTGYVLTDREQDIIEQLKAIQEGFKIAGREISDNKFAELLQLGSSARWSRIRSGDYFSKDVKDPAPILQELERKLERYKQRTKYGQKFENKQFVSNLVFRAVFSAVDECMAKPMSDRKRIVKYIARTGFGKSMLAWQLRENAGAVVVNANRSWHLKHGGSLRQIYGAMQMRKFESTGLLYLENRILEEFQTQRYLLVIDEAEYFGKPILDSIKRWINESNVVIVLLAYPAAYFRWNHKYPMEGEQIQARTHGTYRIDEITWDMATPFLKRMEWDSPETLRRCADHVSAQASKMGGFELIDGTMNRLAGRGKLTQAIFNTALADEQARIVVGKNGEE